MQNDLAKSLNGMKEKNPIASISIEGLFGTKNYELPMEDGIHIFVGENGSGKTTVVRLIRALMSGKIEELKKFRFSQATILFKDGQKFTVNQSDLVEKPINYSQKVDLLDALQKRMSTNDFKRTRSYLLHRTAEEFKVTKRYKKLLDTYSTWINVFLDEYYSALGSKGIYDSKAGKKVTRELRDNLLDLPTYRIFEPGVRGASNNSASEREIRQFIDSTNVSYGMDKASKKIDECLKIMRTHAAEGLSEVANAMITALATNLDLTEEQKMILQDREAIHFLLERVGGRVDEEIKYIIFEELDSGCLVTDAKYKHLATLLCVLAKAYEASIDNHEKMKALAGVCCSYLFEKEAIYDDKELEFRVRHDDGDIIELDNLSSGEKQIVYLFSELLLADNSNRILLFDEPDLSLSIEWQVRYLEDIIKTDSCSLIIAATHSPFIFDNSLVKYTSSISEFIK